MDRGLEYLSCENRLTDLGFLSLERKNFWGDLGEIFQFLKRAYNKEASTWACNNRTKVNGLTLKEERFRLAIRKNFFTEMVRHRSRLHREALGALSLEVLKARLD